jgi:hypothetical protein
VWPVELGREETSGGLEDFVGPPQLSDLPLEPTDLSASSLLTPARAPASTSA